MATILAASPSLTERRTLPCSLYSGTQRSGTPGPSGLHRAGRAGAQISTGAVGEAESRSGAHGMPHRLHLHEVGDGVGTLGRVPEPVDRAVSDGSLDVPRGGGLHLGHQVVRHAREID